MLGVYSGNTRTHAPQTCKQEISVRFSSLNIFQPNEYQHIHTRRASVIQVILSGSAPLQLPTLFDSIEEIKTEYKKVYNRNVLMFFVWSLVVLVCEGYLYHDFPKLKKFTAFVIHTYMEVTLIVVRNSNQCDFLEYWYIITVISSSLKLLVISVYVWVSVRFVQHSFPLRFEILGMRTIVSLGFFLMKIVDLTKTISSYYIDAVVLWN